MIRRLGISFLFVSLILACTRVRGSPTSRPPSIKKLIIDRNPHIDRDRAFRLESIILRVSKRYGFDPFVFAAILAQESSFKRNAHNTTIHVLDGNTKTTNDLGISQINWETWGSPLELDWTKLVHDDEYNINVAAMILRRIKRTHSLKEPFMWWSRYHSNISSKRSQYEDDVMKFFPRSYMVCVCRGDMLEHCGF